MFAQSAAFLFPFSGNSHKPLYFEVALNGVVSQTGAFEYFYFAGECGFDWVGNYGFEPQHFGTSASLRRPDELEGKSMFLAICDQAM
jgi:hypothetical protein